MFQDFSNKSEKKAGPERLSKLQIKMREAGVSMFLVPHADEHQNEYLPERAERLAWLTGFTGSAGFAIPTLSGCTVFVDGRYTLQAREQIDLSAFTPESLTEMAPSKWLEKNATEVDIIGFDPWLVTQDQFLNFRKVAESVGAKLEATDNLIDEIWTDQPPEPTGKVKLHPEANAGKPASEKLAEIQKLVSAEKANMVLLTDPASLAWLFNIRGNDVIHNPIPIGYAIVPASGKALVFMSGTKLDQAVKNALSDIVDFHEPSELTKYLSELSNGRKVHCDTSHTSVALIDTITNSGGEIIKGRDPVVLPRAIKNRIEIEGTRTAHLRDGVAMCRFLYWLDNQKPSDTTEIDAARALENIRAETAIAMGSELLEISFDTISGSGPNGAIVHYRVTEDSNRTFTDNSLYLCDSGAQYADGTTDITRTVAIGSPPANAVRDFTLVLKGHIAIATARFPEGSRGIDLDPFARRALWQEGKDFAHGTGHGVGSYLNVHEGPQSISKRGMEPLLPGMIISNEPGYYVEGEYGIRIENLVLVRKAEQTKTGNVAVHSFETLTLCPIDLRLIDPALLSAEERAWLNAYHAEVRDKLSPHLSQVETEWLTEATKKI